MTVRPSPPMRDFEVSAILREVAEAGSGKSQFRRPLKPQPIGSPWFWEVDEVDPEPGWFDGYYGNERDIDGAPVYEHAPPLRLHFAIGDLLWCREAWQHARQQYCSCPQGSEPCPCDDWCNGEGCLSNRGDVIYRADGECIIRWRSSTQMPRWASRLTLEVVGVKIERLQSISEEDARAEGAVEAAAGWFALAPGQASPIAIGAFALYWQSIRGHGSWSENPFVAAVTFRPLLANVDDLLRQREDGR